jgi:hypothetical protein
MKQVGGRKIGRDHCPLENITRLKQAKNAMQCIHPTYPFLPTVASRGLLSLLFKSLYLPASPQRGLHQASIFLPRASAPDGIDMHCTERIAASH